jgi:hypothetical protein
MSRNFFRWVKLGFFFAAVGGLVVGSLFLYELARGPRMRDQIHLSTFEAMMPLPPAGSVPVNPGVTMEVDENLTNPLPASAAALERGRIYYQYYCLFCHGENGFGDGPVGQSYMPVPTDLHQPKIQAYTDGRLLRAMLFGIGHEPILPRIVRPEHRWHLLLYVREIGKE